MCAKELSDSNFNQAVIGKILSFKEIDPNFTYSQKLLFFKYNLNFLDQLLLPYKLHGSSITGILFSNFASCESLKYAILLFEKKSITMSVDTFLL